MDASAVADSTDWLNTGLPGFAPLEAALRCQVCKDFFDTPMMTSCSHTFCSLCIRRCFAADGRCPTCRATDQDSRLRRNWTAQELVDAFQRARPTALQLAKDAAGAGSENGGEGRTTRGLGNEKKRKLVEVQDSEDEDSQGEERAARRPVRKTRNQPRRSAASSQTPEIIDLEDDGGEDFVAQEEEDDDQPNDGLVACPMCNKRMKEELVFPHLDRCKGPGKDGAPLRSTRTRQSKTLASTTHPLQQRSRNTPASLRNSEPLQRLPQLNYSLLKDTALRKKLSELGIPNSGTRAQLIKRHTEWANLWNANVDSLRPRTKRELLSELDKWERTQSLDNGGMLGNASGAQVMRKDFDGDGWAKNNKPQFDKLIAEARSKRPALKTESQKSEEKKEEEDRSPATTIGTMPLTCTDGPGQSKGYRPYEGNEAALEKVHTRVQDAASGRPHIPHRNSNAMHDEDNASAAAVNHKQASTTSSQTKASPSKSAPINQEKMPSSLPSRLGGSPSKDAHKISMFEIPADPVVDVDTETGK